MKKKIAVCFAIVALVLTMLPSIVFADAAHTASNETELIAAIGAVDNGGTITLTDDIELSETLVIDRAVTFTVDGKGYSIKQASGYIDKQNALILTGTTGASYRAGYDYTLKNVVFDGIDGWSVIRSEGVSLTLDGCTIKNCNNTSGFSLLRLESTETIIKNTIINNNVALTAITHNYNSDGATTNFKLEESVIENNSFNGNAAVYYVEGGSCMIDKSEFINNDINSESNAATIYLGFQENCAVTGCLFKDNDVKAKDASTRVAGAIFFGYEANISKNAFVNNTATNSNGSDGLGQSVCTSTYYDCTIDINDNYWGGSAPVEGVDYFIQHKDGAAEFKPIENYHKEYTLDESGNVIFDVTPEPPINDGEGTEPPAGENEGTITPEKPDTAEPAEEPEDEVDTGDNMNVVIPFAIAALALAAMGTVVATRRRHN